VRVIRGTDEEQLSAAIETIREQLDAYPGEFIAVLAPRADRANALVAELEEAFPGRVTAQRPGTYERFDSEKPIVCTTIHGSKGIEFRCVHILQTEGLHSMPRVRELTYTGITRAKTSLAIYHHKNLPGFLADALAADEPPAAAPPPESLFE
jgi:superfamily I DNA/RNA helicase